MTAEVVWKQHTQFFAKLPSGAHALVSLEAGEWLVTIASPTLGGYHHERFGSLTTALLFAEADGALPPDSLRDRTMAVVRMAVQS